MNLPEWLFEEKQAPCKNKIKKVYNPKPSKQIAKENFKSIDKKLENEIFKRMKSPFYFIKEKLKKIQKYFRKS